MRSSEEDVMDLLPVIERERSAMESDLLRARALLRDGMSKLHGFFDALSDTVSAQSKLLAKLRDAHTLADERESALEQLQSDHEQVLSVSKAAIQGLQLEDVLGQLLDYTSKRTQDLSSLAALLAQAVEPDALARNSTLRQKLRDVLAKADQRAHELAVRQESLGSGDVELF